MQVPEWFEHNRNRKTNVQVLRDITKEEQLLSGEAPISEDLLLRSLRETQKNMMPFLAQLGWKPALNCKLA